VTAGLLVLAAVFLVQSISLGPLARLVPLTVSIPTLALLALQLGFDLSRGAADPPERDELRAFAWIAALPASIALVGIVAAAPAWTLLYLKARGEAWATALGLSAVAGVLPWLVFRFLLPSGSLGGQLGAWLSR
jgi:hypothetical protein